jgi:hypothetical protein
MFGIMSGRDSRTVRVKYQKNTVFLYDYGGYSNGKGTSIFIPGDWEKPFDRLYKNALQAEQEFLEKEEWKKRQKEKDKENDLKKRFGL